jgi:hypothetical protein
LDKSNWEHRFVNVNLVCGLFVVILGFFAGQVLNSRRLVLFRIDLSCDPWIFNLIKRDGCLLTVIFKNRFAVLNEVAFLNPNLGRTRMSRTSAPESANT